MNILSNSSRNANYSNHFSVYYRNLELYYLSWYLPLTCFVGIIGGVACVVFLSISKIFPNNVLIWMLSIFVGDLMILAFDATRMLVKVLFRFDIRDMNDSTCKLHNFLSNYFIYWSGYMQACMSIQRLYSIMRPLQARGIFTVKLVLLVWFSVTLILVGPILPYLLFWQLSDEKDGKDCSPATEHLYSIITILDIIFWGIIPLMAMTASTIGISFVVFNSTNNITILSTQSQSLVAGNILTKRNNQRNTDNAWHVTRLLISMNILYFVSNFPLLIYQIYLNAGGNKVNKSMPQQLHKTIYYTLRSICYLSSSWNWIFYCIGGKKFRDKAVQIVQSLKCFGRSAQNVDTETKSLNS